MSKEIKAPKSPFTGVNGWESVDEQALLIKYARLTPMEGIILEVGSEYGMSASIWARYSAASKIYCVEINPEAPFLKILAENNITTNAIEFVNIDSRKADCEQIIGKGNLIDTLFIDGDHSYEGALNDLIKFAPFVRKYGHLIVHDTACSTNKNPHESHYAVYTAIQHYMANHGGNEIYAFDESVDSTMVYERVK